MCRIYTFENLLLFWLAKLIKDNYKVDSLNWKKSKIISIVFSRVAFSNRLHSSLCLSTLKVRWKLIYTWFQIISSLIFFQLICLDFVFVFCYLSSNIWSITLSSTFINIKEDFFILTFKNCTGNIDVLPLSLWWTIAIKIFKNLYLK